MSKQIKKRPSIEEVRRTLNEIRQEGTEVWLLFEEAKFLLAEAKRHASSDTFRSSAYSRMAIVQSVFALEAFLRMMLEPRLAKAFMPIAYESLRTLKDRAQFLKYRVSGLFFQETDAQWQALCRAIAWRNKLAHPGPSMPVRKVSMKIAVDVVMACVRFVGTISSEVGVKPAKWTTSAEPELLHMLDAKRKQMLDEAFAGP